VQRRLPIDDGIPIWRALLVFLIPLMLSNVLQSSSATFNSIYLGLGRLIGVKALAAVSAINIFPLQFFLVSFFIGISSGSSVLIGQAHGAGNHERVGPSRGQRCASRSPSASSLESRADSSPNRSCG
jgi:Na+-driven multidrug efflux pump